MRSDISTFNLFSFDFIVSNWPQWYSIPTSHIRKIIFIRHEPLLEDGPLTPVVHVFSLPREEFFSRCLILFFAVVFIHLLRGTGWRSGNSFCTYSSLRGDKLTPTDLKPSRCYPLAINYLRLDSGMVSLVSSTGILFRPYL